MTLRTLQFLLTGALLAASVTLWRRDIDARRDFEAGGARLAELSAGLSAEKARAEGLREDLAELRTQLDRTRKLRDEAQAEALREREAFAGRTREWSRAIAGWEQAVKARDARIAEMSERERRLVARLEEAVRHAEAAAARAEEMRRRVESSEAAGR
jgi:chromosome segregation ATPase